MVYTYSEIENHLVYVFADLDIMNQSLGRTDPRLLDMYIINMLRYVLLRQIIVILFNHQKLTASHCNVLFLLFV